VCFEDSFYIVLHVDSYTFGVDVNPIRSYNFGDQTVPEGVKTLMDGCSSEDELKQKLYELIGNNGRCVVNFSDYKKVKIKGFLGVKTLKASNSALSYISFNAAKDVAKQLVAFYPNL
jgi:hypothetical protein